MARLADITDIIMGQSPDGASVTENTSGMEFHQGKIHFTDRELAYSGQFTSEANKVAAKGSVLLCVRAPVGIVNITDRDIAIGRGLCALRPLGGILVEFIFHWLSALQNSFVEQATGTTFMAISIDVVRNELIPIPPLEEQRRLVDVIEQALKRLNEIAENLS